VRIEPSTLVRLTHGRPGAITVLTGAFLIDCTGTEPVDGAAAVIEGERITDVIRSGKVGPLKGRVETLSLKGRTHLIMKGGRVYKHAL